MTPEELARKYRESEVETLAERLYGAAFHAEAINLGKRWPESWSLEIGVAFQAAEEFLDERDRRRGQ